MRDSHLPAYPLDRSPPTATRKLFLKVPPDSALFSGLWCVPAPSSLSHQPQLRVVAISVSSLPFRHNLLQPLPERLTSQGILPYPV